MKYSACRKRGFVGYSLSHAQKYLFIHIHSLPSKFTIFYYSSPRRKSIRWKAQKRNCLKCFLSHFPNGWLVLVFTPFLINRRLANRAKLLWVYKNSSAYYKKASGQNTIAPNKKLATKAITSLIKTTNIFVLRFILSLKKTK